MISWIVNLFEIFFFLFDTKLLLILLFQLSIPRASRVLQKREQSLKLAAVELSTPMEKK